MSPTSSETDEARTPPVKECVLSRRSTDRCAGQPVPCENRRRMPSAPATNRNTVHRPSNHPRSRPNVPPNHRQRDDRCVQSEQQSSNRHNRRSPAQSEAQSSGRHQHGDVLLWYQERNRHPRSPDLDYLQERQRGEDCIEEGEEAEEEQTEKDEDDVVVIQPTRRSRKRLNGPIPTQLWFYPPVYRDLLEKAKKRSRLESLDNSFPHRETFLAEDAIEILAELHDQFAAEGRGVEEGYWESYKHNMAIIVFCFLFCFCYLIH